MSKRRTLRRILAALARVLVGKPGGSRYPEGVHYRG